MPVEKGKTFSYFSISKEGKIRSTSGNDKDEKYKFIWGVLVGIEFVKDSWEGETIYKYHFKLEDPSHGSMDILQVGEASSAARGMIMSLISIPGNIHQVKFTPFNKNHDGRTYTNVWVEHRTHEADPWEDTPEWDKKITKHLPDIKEVKLSDGRNILDDGERRKYIRGLAARIKKTKLNLRPDEVVDEETGEIMDGRQAAESAYGEPAPEKVTQQREELHEHNFDDMDDSLPF